MGDAYDCHLYALGARTDWAFGAVNDDPDCAAFSMKGDTHTFFLVRKPRWVKVENVINHEILHLVLNRLGLIAASNRLDLVSNTNGKYRHLWGGL